ncbi:cytochrome P450 9e2-like isoform X1 [Harpegnathos saltator]|uniref:cytochrome P450 9e2-like isoform X1 n=1 Tax=Harpegnathos saltator TaxID=610380 RepID=UPI000DBEEA35|nr:cytochrome P450 9e2-like isoform X1 [Harpegnathos saltator]
MVFNSSERRFSRPPFYLCAIRFTLMNAHVCIYNTLCRKRHSYSFSGSLITMESSSFSLSLFSSPFALLLTTLVTIGVLKVIAYLYHQHMYWKKRGVPQIRTIVGLEIFWKLLLRRISFTEHNQFIYNYVPDAKYIGLMSMATPLVLLRDPELIKDVMVKDFEHFPDHKSIASEEADPLFGKNVFSLRGNRWKKMRNTLSPSFTASKMKVMFELVSKCAREFAEYLADHPELCSSIDTKEAFRRYTTDVIATSAFGISVNSMKDRNNEFFLRGTEASMFGTFKFTFILKMIFHRICPRLARILGMSFISPATSQFFKRIVAESINVRKKQGIVRPDMIHLLMQARDKEDPNMHEMTLDDIVAQALIFFLAGFDTSATLMCFVVHELAVHRDIQDRLWEEVEKHFAERNGEITYETISKMVYMDMVLSEVLRKYPPVIFIDRLCVRRYELPPAKLGCMNVIVEPDSMTMTPVYALHHDPKYFPNPSKFDPERFSDECKENIVPYTYLPFGLGPRKCIGNRFALMETKVLVAHLLHRFIFKTTEKTVEPIVFDKKQFTLQPDGGFWITLEKRQK